MTASLMMSELQEGQRDALPSRARTRICHVSMGLKTGGLERLLVDFARFHDPREFELSFISLGELGPPAEDLRAAGHAVTTCGFPQCGKGTLLRRLRDFFKLQQPDVIHTHNTYPHFYAAIAARWAGIKHVVNTQHGRGCGNGWKSHWQFRIANRLSQRVIGVSEDATKLCQSQDRGGAGQMECIWNGIDVERFRFTGPINEPVAISVARLSPEKDYETLLRAVRFVANEQPAFRLQLVGDGVERPRLEKLARDLNLQQHVEFLGERKDIPQLLSQSGFFVSSSKTEGISLTLLEAMAVGLPIVTTAVGGSPEIVREGVTGLLVPAQDPAALSQAMLKMLNQASDWREMGQAARTRVESCFEIRRMIREYETLYRTVQRERTNPQR